MSLIENTSQRTKVVINSLVFLVAIVTFSQRELSFRSSSRFDNILIDSFGPVQSLVHSGHSKLSSFFNHYVANVSASKSNIELQKKVEELENKVFGQQELLKENTRLKGLLKFGEEVSYGKVLAQVVAWDSASDFRVIRINKGLKDGIDLQSPVVTADGLVGYIFRLTDHFADILTIMDNNNRVDGIIQRIRSHGIVEGRTATKCLMKYISRTEPVILGDTVITSGLGNIYPKGVRIGRVSRIERESYGITQYIEITPAVDFGRLEEVAVLVANNDKIKKREWQALNEMDDGEEGKK